jgi:drug/metabolite transporter (DMT)-like permease
MTLLRTILLTALSLVAFASNSLLCRMALGRGAIDPASFTSIRLVSGAVTLVVIALLSWRGRARLQGNWRSGFLLFVYGVTFSFAYTQLAVATGALILFATVQTTMMGIGIWNGERLRRLEWIGVFVGLAGLIILLLPGLQTPSALGACLMGLAGAAWGIYTLRGRDSKAAVLDTAGNFVWAIPFALAVSLVGAQSLSLSNDGMLLAVVSGALASGVGYVIWYAALRGLSAMQASMVQLMVPALAAMGGAMILEEPLTLRLLTSAVLILGGVALGLTGRYLRLPTSTRENRNGPA